MENELYEADEQDNYIARAGRPVFGTVTVDSAHCTSCAEAKITKGNLNSGEKRHKIKKLKNACARSQRTEDGVLKCDCPIRSKNLPEFSSIETLLTTMKAVHGGVWPQEAQEDLKASFLKIFAMSAFNTCTVQELPMMTGDKMKICIDSSKEHRPVNIPIPYNVPVHCRDAVYQQL